MLYALDILLFVVHFAVMMFIVLGWASAKTRKYHLIVLGATLVSWFVMGYWKGWGYCVLTDWEWDIKRELGEQNLPPSYTGYIFNRILGLNLSNITVDWITGLGLLFGVIMGVYVNWPKKSKKS
ncbi:MAG: DUF2784 family protein [Bacteroidota bacterium]